MKNNTKAYEMFNECTPVLQEKLTLAKSRLEQANKDMTAALSNQRLEQLSDTQLRYALSNQRLEQLSDTQLRYFISLLEYLAAIQTGLHEAFLKPYGDPAHHMAEVLRNQDTEIIYVNEVENMTAALLELAKRIPPSLVKGTKALKHMEVALYNLDEALECLIDKTEEEQEEVAHQVA